MDNVGWTLKNLTWSRWIQGEMCISSADEFKLYVFNMWICYTNNSADVVSMVI